MCFDEKMRYLQFGSCRNFERQQITSSSYSKVHRICQSPLSGPHYWYLSLRSLYPLFAPVYFRCLNVTSQELTLCLLGAMCTHVRSLGKTEGGCQCCAPSPLPPQVAPPSPGRLCWCGDHQRSSPTRQPGQQVTHRRGYGMGSHRITPCSILCG